MSHEQLARTFDRWAAEGRAAEMEHGHGEVARAVIARMGIRPGEQILDLGCGSGWATRLLARSAPGASAVGVDVSPAMIARADELHSFTVRARYEVAAFEELGLADARFDRVFSMEALYYAVDLERALAEAHRVLKPGGTADVVVDYYKENTATAHWCECTGVGMHYLGEAEWRMAFERAGFAAVRLERVRDTRGPGERASFVSGQCFQDWETWRKFLEAGSLWIHGEKP